MRDNTIDNRDVLMGSGIGGANATTIKPDEATFIDTLVDHLVDVDTVARDGVPGGSILYFDPTLAGNVVNQDQLFNRRLQRADAPRPPNVPWAALCCVGMAAVDLYCKRAFGERFDQIADDKQKHVLSLLDSIKCVFEDGSDVGVFAAIAYQAMNDAKNPRSRADTFTCHGSNPRTP